MFIYHYLAAALLHPEGQRSDTLTFVEYKFIFNEQTFQNAQMYGIVVELEQN